MWPMFLIFGLLPLEAWSALELLDHLFVLHSPVDKRLWQGHERALNSVQSLGDTPGWEEYSIHMSASDGPLSLQLAIQVKYDSYNIQQGLESVTDHILCQLQGYLAVQWMHSAVAAL